MRAVSWGLILSDVRARMRTTGDMEKAVHELYFVVENRVYVDIASLRAALGVSRPTYYKCATGQPNHDAIVAALLPYAGTNTLESIALSVKRARPDAGEVANVRDGEHLIIWCKVCGRPCMCTYDEAKVFTHSERFCLSHTEPSLFACNVSGDRLRDLIAKRGSYEAALKSYQAKAHSVGLDAFIFHKCSVCGAKLLLPSDVVQGFTHGPMCEEYLWEEA